MSHHLRSLHYPSVYRRPPALVSFTTSPKLDLLPIIPLEPLRVVLRITADYILSASSGSWIMSSSVSSVASGCHGPTMSVPCLCSTMVVNGPGGAGPCGQTTVVSNWTGAAGADCSNAERSTTSALKTAERVFLPPCGVLNQLPFLLMLVMKTKYFFFLT